MNAFIFVWRIGFLFYHNVRMRIQKIFVIKRNVANDTKSIGNDVEYIIQIYRIVHDMEYFLFRYGIEDVGRYVDDISTTSKYYGVLTVYE